jgi:tetratricopeptide (TPR) repeat protein
MAGILGLLKSEWWMVQGRLSGKRKQHNAALQFFQRVVSLYPEHLLAQCYVGYSYMELLRYDDAVLAFERGLQIRSDSAYCHAGLGRAYKYLSKNREAIESLNRAFRINPKYEQDGNYVLTLAAAYGGLRDYETSRKFYEEAAKLLPRNADAHHCLGWALRALGRSQDAEAPLRRAIALIGDDPASHDELGNVLFDLGRWTEAEQEFRRAIELNPDNPDPHHSLGLTLGRQNRFAEGIGSYKEAIRLHPAHDDAYCDLGLAHSILGDYEEAIKAYEAALQINPVAPDTLLNLCNAYAQCKRWNESLQMSERLIELKPEDEEGHFYLAVAHSALDRDAEAIEAYQQAIRINPNSIYGTANLGLSCVKVGRLPEAASALERAIELKLHETEDRPFEIEVRASLGETYVKLGNLSAAREQLRILTEVDRDAAAELSKMIASA